MNINAITTTPEAVKGFYPAPPKLADKLLADIDWDYIGTVLEPSAGKGDLVKAAVQKARVHRCHSELDMDCVEIDPYLRSILEYEFKETDAGLALIREYRNMLPYLLDSFDKEDKFGFTTLTLCAGDPSKAGGRGSVPSVNKFLGLVRRKYWEALFRNKEFVGKLTSNLRQQYQSMVGKMANYDFTLFNIQMIAAQMNAEMNQGVQETIVALFDKMTEQHTWYPEMAKNIHYYNGWKTNKAHKLTNKVVLPIYGVFSTHSWCRDTFNVREAENIISDMEKVFDYLDGNATTAVDLHGVLQIACNKGQTRNIPGRSAAGPKNANTI